LGESRRVRFIDREWYFLPVDVSGGCDDVLSLDRHEILPFAIGVAIAMRDSPISQSRIHVIAQIRMARLIYLNSLTDELLSNCLLKRDACIIGISSRRFKERLPSTTGQS
jgi:hypothetical protein